MTEGLGQVAFTTIEAVDKYFKERRTTPDGKVLSADDYQFLCLDGTRMPVTRRACDWSRRPSNVFVIRKGKGKVIVVKVKREGGRVLAVIQQHLLLVVRPPSPTKQYIHSTSRVGLATHTCTNGANGF